MSMIVKGLRYLKHYGLKEFFIRIREKRELNQTEVSYEEWYEIHCCKDAELQRQRKLLEGRELSQIGIILLHKSLDEKERNAFLHSLARQTYSNYILIEYDKATIRQQLSILDEIVIVDTVSVLCDNFLYEIHQALGECEVVYSDSDMLDLENQKLHSVHLKSDYNIDLLRSYNYIGNVLAMSKCSFKAIMDGFESKNWSLYEIALACWEQKVQVGHISKVLYHELKENCVVDSKAVERHIQNCNEKAQVVSLNEMTRVHYSCKEFSKVSIIIPNKDHVDVLEQCLESIANSSYTNYEIIIVENNSTQEETFAFYEKLSMDRKIRVVTYDSKGVFNYSAINNYGVSFATGEYLILLNNDIQMITTNWIEELLSVAQRKEVGIVGAKLYYPDDTIQHAGVLVGIGGHVRGVATNAFVGLSRTKNGYENRASLMCDYSAVTAACMMIRKTLFDEIGGFEEKLAVAFNDVDLCLRVREKNYLVVYDPFVEAYHHESKSRGQEDSKEKLKRFQSEIEYMRTRWISILRKGDPYYNVGFSRVKNDFSL